MSTVFFDSECYLRSGVENGLDKKRRYQLESVALKLSQSKPLTETESNTRTLEKTY